MDKNKTVVIGIDGATFDIIYPLLQERKLPNIASILVSGVSTSLRSVIPPITAPAWTSFITGVNPGIHGIFDFISGIHLNGKEGSLLNSTDIRTKTMLDYLGEGQKKVITVGVPFTYPATKINGVMVSLSMGCDIDVYPKKLMKPLIDNTGYDKEQCKPVDTFGEVPKEEVLDEVIKRANYLTGKIRDISCYLLKNQEWDFFMAHFMSTDTIQHYFWNFMDTKHPAYDERLADKYRNTIHEAYRMVDSAIGQILRQSGDGCNVIIVSDHGFAPIYKFFYVNKWLQDKGLLHVRNDEKRMYKFKLAFPTIYKVFKRLGLESVGRILPRWLRSINIPAIKRCTAPFYEWIDWKRTMAYASPFGININLKGREPEGIVDEGDYEKIRQLIKYELYKLKDAFSGINLIKEVLFREEVYDGPYLANASDLFFTFKEPYFLQASDVMKPTYFEELSKETFATANHRYSPEGIFMMKGPNIKSDGNLHNLNIVDIAPTILYLSGLKIPRTMEGRVITESIDTDYLLANQVKFVEVEFKEKATKSITFGENDESKIKEHLRRLGYLG